MSFDTSMPCPGGRQQRIRECSSCRPFLGDLAKVHRALEGNQGTAARRQLDALCETYPDRPCLLSLRAHLAIQRHDIELIRQCVERGLAATPGNVLFIALDAMLAAFESRSSDAVPLLQQCLEAAPNYIPSTLVYAAEALAYEFLSEDNYAAARAHAYLKCQLDGTFDEPDPDQNLARQFDMKEAPAVLKSIGRMRPVDRPPCADRAAAAAESAARGRWLSALKMYEELDGEVPDCPEVLQNIGDLQARLGMRVEAVRTWRRCASLPALDEDDAVEAEARALLLDAENLVPADTAERTFPVGSVERIMELLLSDPRAIHISATVHMEDGSPPPKAVFQVVERPIDPDPAVPRPEVLAMVLVFGKQTDREARVSLASHDPGSAEEWLRAMAGDLIQDATSEVVVEKRQRVDLEIKLDPNLYVNDLSPLAADDMYRTLVESELFDKWPNRETKFLDGRRPVDVAGDGAWRRRLLGLILAIEQSLPAPCADVDVDRLRQQLDLPRTEEIAFDSRLPAHRWPRVRLDNLSDDDLVRVFVLCRSLNLWRGLYRAAKAILQRESLVDKFDWVYQCVASLNGPRHRLLELIDDARTASVAQGRSPAQWLLAELPFRIIAKDAERTSQLWTEIGKYTDDPAVQEQLFSMMVELGMITPSGEMTSSMADAMEKHADPQAPAQPESRIWTPGQDDATGRGKSKLWVPDA